MSGKDKKTTPPPTPRPKPADPDPLPMPEKKIIRRDGNNEKIGVPVRIEELPTNEPA